jgi:hypothetical protein
VRVVVGLVVVLVVLVVVRRSVVARSVILDRLQVGAGYDESR